MYSVKQIEPPEMRRPGHERRLWMSVTSEALARDAQQGEKLVVTRFQSGKITRVGFMTQQPPRVEVTLPPGTRLTFLKPAIKAGWRGLIQQVLGGELGKSAIFLPCRDYIQKKYSDEGEPMLPELMRVLDFGPHGRCPVRELRPGLKCTVHSVAQAPQKKALVRK